MVNKKSTFNSKPQSMMMHIVQHVKTFSKGTHVQYITVIKNR